MPDLNVWLALSWANHMHSAAAWTWFSRQADNRFFFCRFTQIGLLRLLATSAVMGEDVLTIGEAWKVYDRWLEDSRIGIRQESFELDPAFRAAARPVSRQSSPKALGDCYLLVVSQVRKRDPRDIRPGLGIGMPKGPPTRHSALNLAYWPDAEETIPYHRVLCANGASGVGFFDALIQPKEAPN